MLKIIHDDRVLIPSRGKVKSAYMKLQSTGSVSWRLC